MSSLVGLKTDSWDLTKGKIEWVDTWPMMASPGPVAIVLAVYILFVLRVGPAYMEKRSPYKLKWTLILYNSAQVIFSIFLAAKCLLHTWRHGLVHSKCLMDEQETQNEVTNCIWWYFVAKVTELLDTVFFVLRKKDAQVTFLHIYHHSIMMAGSWVLLKYGPTDHVLFPGFLNSVVHIVMYGYYAVAALGPQYAKYLWWKKYLTAFQLTQFCVMLVYLGTQWYGNRCRLPRWTVYFAITLVSSFLVLFLKFYSDSYIPKARTMKQQLARNNIDDSQVTKSTSAVKFIEDNKTEENNRVIRRIT